jgi:hypothetical protein
MAGEEKIIIRWDRISDPNLNGYNIFRSASENGPFKKINSELLTVPEYFDGGMLSSTKYYYQVEYVIGGEGGTFSEVISGSIQFYAWYIDNVRVDGVTKLEKKRARNRSVRSVMGSKKQVIQDRGFMPEDLTLEIYCYDDENSTGEKKYNDLVDVLSQTKVLRLRDPFGREFFVAPGDFEDDQLLTGKLEYLISINLTEVAVV